MTPAIDGQQITIGGLVTTMRSIVTKSGTKMAFVGIEDKTGEAEVIVFPKLYTMLAESLKTDVVVKVTGKISARDRDGNMTGDAKMIADEISVVSDKELNSYESHGNKMKAPTGPAAVKSWRKKANSEPKIVTAKMPEEIVPQSVVLKTVYVHIDSPDDHQMLISLKKLCGFYPGQNNVIMVLGSDKASAIKLPFRVEADDVFTKELEKLLGEGKVILK
jgi:DNA polymerase-3 subunit alpha